MTSTALPLPRDLLGRAVQGYSPQGQPDGQASDRRGYLPVARLRPNLFSSRDMATFLSANIGELADHGAVESAMGFAQQPVFTVSLRLKIRPCLADREQRKSEHPLQERWTEQHIDLHRVRSAEQVRGSFSLTEVNNTPPGLADKTRHIREEKSEPSNEGEPDRERLSL